MEIEQKKMRTFFGGQMKLLYFIRGRTVIRCLRPDEASSAIPQSQSHSHRPAPSPGLLKPFRFSSLTNSGFESYTNISSFLLSRVVRRLPSVLSEPMKREA